MHQRLARRCMRVEIRLSAPEHVPDGNGRFPRPTRLRQHVVETAATSSSLSTWRTAACRTAAGCRRWTGRTRLEQHAATRLAGAVHRDGAVAGQRRVGARHPFALVAVAVGAMLVVQLRAAGVASRRPATRRVGCHGRPAARQGPSGIRHGAQVGVAQVLGAVVAPLRPSGPSTEAWRRHAVLQQRHHLLACPVAARRLRRGEASDGAYQFCVGIRPPRRSSVQAACAPSTLRAEWQAAQWPRPCTR